MTCRTRMRASLLGLLLASCTTPADTVLHTEKSLYRNILVYETGGLRCMKFGRQDPGRQSCMDLADRDRLVFEYTRMMMAALYLNPRPQRILVVGLGGGSLPTALRQLLPAAEMDVVEIDSAVVRVARRFFAFTADAHTRVIESDGRVFVKRALKQNRRYDLIMLDAFDHQYIPEHLLTREFLQEVRGLLADGAVLAANTFSSSRLYNSESATYFEVFGPFYGLRRDNRVILLRRGGLPSKEDLARNADALESGLLPLGAGKSWLLGMFVVESGWPADSRVLTDQYSPANLLNGRR